MGIQGLHKWIREKFPQAVSHIPLKKFSGRRLAVDATNICYEIWASAYREVIKETDVLTDEVDRNRVQEVSLKKLFTYLKKLLSNGVLPVFVFDGGYCPEKNKHAHIRRQEIRKKASLRLSQLEEEIEALEPALRALTFLETKRKLLSQVEGPEQELIIMRVVLFATGIPCISAYSEAEKVCSQLCYEGLVDAVLSSDSDNLPHGCLMLLARLYGTEGAEMVEGFSLPRLLSLMKLERSSFIDLCIMAGCDYNENIKGIGINRAYTLIQKHGRIEDLPPSFGHLLIDKEQLNFQACRELFALQASSNLAEEIPLTVGEMDLLALQEQGVYWGPALKELLQALPLLVEQTILTRL